MANMRYTLNSIESTVKRTLILETLQANKKKYVAEFLKAQELYHKMATEALESRLHAFREGKGKDLSFNIPKPKNHTSEYDKTIAFFEASNDESITLTKEQWDSIVNDEWDFRFEASTIIGALNEINVSNSHII